MAVFLFPGGGGGAESAGLDRLAVADAVLLGTSYDTQNGDSIDVAIPLPVSAMTTPATASAVRVYPLTAADGTTRITAARLGGAKMQVDIDSIPAGSGEYGMFVVGFVFSSSASAADVDLSSDTSRWLCVSLGEAGSDAGDRAQRQVGSGNGLLNPSNPTNGANRLHFSIIVHHEDASTIRITQVVGGVTGTANGENTNAGDTTLTAGHYVYAFLATGRGVTSGKSDPATWGITPQVGIIQQAA